jgi:hypothetical protein
MSVRTALRSPALVCALGMGVLADELVRAPGRPGINVALWALVGVAVLFGLQLRRFDPPSRESWWLVGGALAFAFALTLRDAEALAVFSLFGAVGLLALAAGRAAIGWAARAQLSDVAFAVARVGLLSAGGPLGWGRAAPREPDTRVTRWAGGARVAVRGTAMALPPLVVLSIMLMSADEVFAQIIQNLFRFDIGPLVQHVVFSAFIAWGTAGFLRAFLVRDDAVMAQLRLPQPAIAAAEVTVALWILNLLFAGFMAVQLRYLFGGASMVEVTAGLTYAQYARSGFFELVATAALVVPILLVADWAAVPGPSRARNVLRATTLVLVVLLVGVIASAAYRMQLYQEAYGLTEQRLYVSVIIVWLTAVLGWLVITVLRGRRERFAFGAIVAGLISIAALHVLNPHALIARVNLDRAANGAEYDGAYLTSLSADAVPTILSRLEQLPMAEQCRASRYLLKRWSGQRPGGWRTWNLSDSRARRLVANITVPAMCPAEEVEAQK